MNHPNGSGTPNSFPALPQVRNSEKSTAHRPASDLNLSFRRSNASLSALFAGSPTSLSKRASSPVVRNHSSGQGPSFATAVATDPYRSLVLRSFIPHIAVLPSADTEELLAQKGFNGGLLEILRPYGENIVGKVTIRDSVGASKSYEDYAVRFVKLRDGLENPREPNAASGINEYMDQLLPQYSARLRTGGDVELVEETISKHLQYAEHPPPNVGGDNPLHQLYLCRLLSGLPLSPHETISHPVACVVAISSRNSDPIEELRNLYTATTNGDLKMPAFVNNDYLRYYVLVHDEDHDDVQRSTTLFEQMKRHFGLHCHLLRVRSTQCVPSDDDAVRLPVCDWLSAAEELCEIERREGLADMDDIGPCLYESDAASIRSLVRELVTQSVVPMLERQCATWNDQIISRRRGFGGRFLSLSKKWTPFGSQQDSTNPSYNTVAGYYKLDAETTLLRRLADTCLMLRDLKLAHTAYDLLRTDTAADKAWKHYAGACEMTAISSLLNGDTPLSNKSSSSSIESLLQATLYQYATRCNAPFYALRAISVATELLRMRGASAADDAAQWASRLLETRLVGPVGTVLFAERVSVCFSLRQGVGARHIGARCRKSALWDVIAAQRWLEMGHEGRAKQSLQRAWSLYSPGSTGHQTNFDVLRLVLEALDRMVNLDTDRSEETVVETMEEVQNLALSSASPIRARFDQSADIAQDLSVVPTEEKVDIRRHRHSLIAAPLSGDSLKVQDPVDAQDE